jgi:COMPASS component SWD2
MHSFILNSQILSSFKPSKVFNISPPDPPTSFQPNYTSIAFSQSGDHLVTSSSDEKLQLFDCRKGKLEKEVFSKKYGVNLARFTHGTSNLSLIYASTKEEDSIRYLSLFDNSYLRYFKGHKKK